MLKKQKQKELYMFPPILMFYPNLAKQVLSYRTHNKEALAFNAKQLKLSGWKIPWRSAFTSVDVAPHCCPYYADHEHHINGFVSFAARQYLSATRDLDWLLNESGNELINKLAEFWQSRMTYSKLKSQFEILNVIPPDEDVGLVNNSVTTNVVAAMSIFLADYSNCLANVSENIDKNMLHKARCIHIPFDHEQKVHLEYENYVVKEQQEYADVVFLIYPLMWPMEDEVRKHDLWFNEASMSQDFILNLYFILNILNLALVSIFA